MSSESDRSAKMQALAVEHAVGAALLSPQGAAVYAELSLLVRAEDFADEVVRALFSAYSRLTDDGVVPDVPVLMAAAVGTLGNGRRVTLALSKIGSAPFNSQNFAVYGKSILERSRARRLAGQLSSAVEALSAGEKVLAVAGQMDQAVQQAQEGIKINGLLAPVSDFVHAGMTRIMEAVDDRESPQNDASPGAGKILYTYGVRELDERLGRPEPGDLYVIGARPSMGKSALALQGALSLATAGIDLTSGAPPDDYIVPFFAMEMTDGQLALRALAHLGQISHSALRKGALTDEDFSKLTYACQLLSCSRLRIDFSPAHTPGTMRAAIRQAVRNASVRGKSVRVGSIYVDYIQLMKGDAKRYENRASEITAISAEIKALGKEFDCPVFALAQLNRSLEQRPNKRPLMSDLRESGALEQDAAAIIFPYRDEVYNPDSPYKGLAEMIVGKARHGMDGPPVMAEWLGDFQLFRGLAAEPGHRW